MNGKTGSWDMLVEQGGNAYPMGELKHDLQDVSINQFFYITISLITFSQFIGSWIKIINY